MIECSPKVMYALVAVGIASTVWAYMLGRHAGWQAGKRAFSLGK